MAKTQYKCPNPDCPATDFEPIPSTANEEEIQTELCAGDCSTRYPVGAVKKVRTT